MYTCRELDTDSDDNKSANEDPLANIPMTNFAEMDYAGTEVKPSTSSVGATVRSLQ